MNLWPSLASYNLKESKKIKLSWILSQTRNLIAFEWIVHKQSKNWENIEIFSRTYEQQQLIKILEKQEGEGFYFKRRIAVSQW